MNFMSILKYAIDVLTIYETMKQTNNLLLVSEIETSFRTYVTKCR